MENYTVKKINNSGVTFNASINVEKMDNYSSGTTAPTTTTPPTKPDTISSEVALDDFTEETTITKDEALKAMDEMHSDFENRLMEMLREKFRVETENMIKEKLEGTNPDTTADVEVPVMENPPTQPSVEREVDLQEVTTEVVENVHKDIEVLDQDDELVEQLDETTIAGDSSGIDLSKYHSKPEKGFEVTTGNTTYNLTDSEFDTLVAIVSAECDHSYDDALAVASVILNRCEDPAWVASFGTNPLKQATAKNQFVVYQHGSYKKYTNGNAPDTVRQALQDALAGLRNNSYLSFRSNGSKGYSSNMITDSGNRYK